MIIHPNRTDSLYLTWEQAEFIHRLPDKNIRAVAQLLDCSDSALYQKLAGKYPITLQQLEVVCREFQITPRQLMACK